jgi:predicted hotdog family 3-hydroxylacyl-ACP dehydratase
MSGENAVFRLRDAGVAEGGRRIRVEIPPASPLFAGHFPGHPIFPGIAHLALAARALRDFSAVGSLCAVRALKLRRRVAPGDALELFIGAPAEDGWCRFDLRRGEETISGGAVQMGPSGDAGCAPAPSASPAGMDFPPVETLLPHAPPARLIRGILAATAEEVVCAAEIPLLHPLVEEGRLPAFVGIEAAAQAAAVLEALNRRQDAAGPRIGYLVGVRQARFAVPFLTPGRPMRVTARLQGGAFLLSIYDITVGDPSHEVVTGSISTFIAGAEDRDPTLTRGG